MGALGSVLMAMILLDLSMPARCWMAPEMPAAIYRRGRTVSPVWPTWCSRPISPASTAAREAPTSPPSRLARSRISSNSPAPSTPPPPATITGASFSLTVGGRSSRLSTCRAKSCGWKTGVTASTVPWRAGSGSRRRITPSRTLAICGRVLGLTMVAMMLPPKAGRIW